ncbi:SDR family NAD(P)-dependent oxidoreductase [Bacilliculturomica massiliensis]|uniref:SDR family NAD(P)-dependent oxidoreductase n=1 Tax=Bacilliculturomica massiliensis TaxID=1917867 RepID=UPI001030633F|nr:SDR family NAD(P)-dependent oxidoreductase [Bacilliculturomica massiliensis]
MDYLNLTGKTAVVTGGAQGIGLAVAEELAAFGVHVVICDIKEREGKDAAEKITALGGSAIFCRCDVTSPAEIKQATDTAIKEFGRLDILINNAGIGSDCHATDELTDAEWNRMMDVDLKGPFNFCREAVPHMRRQKYGKIVNISSGGGIGGMLFLAHYSAAKAGLFGFTKSLAKELAPLGINVNCIAVPTTLTPATTFYDYDSDWQEELKLIPMGRIAQPKDIADMVLYLVSDASAYVTGQVLSPNGGKR